MATVDASTKGSGMNYEEMSDLQINLLVANAIGVDASENDGVVFASVKHEGDNVVSVIGAVDYCNNPSDAWPIMLDNKIGVWNHPSFGDEWTARLNIVNTSTVVKEIEYATHRDKNPLRAAMIVFLMMKDSENV